MLLISSVVINLSLVSINIYYENKSAYCGYLQKNMTENVRGLRFMIWILVFILDLKNMDNAG